MATLRDNPYGAYNFLVSLGGAQGGDELGAVIGGFTTVTGLSATINPIEYRNGNDNTNASRLIAGRPSYPPVTLSRGVIGSTDLFDWFQAIVTGAPDRRVVTITLLDEARTPVLRWKLSNAWPAKYEAPDLNATGNEVAIESLTLVHSGLEID